MVASLSRQCSFGPECEPLADGSVLLYKSVSAFGDSVILVFVRYFNVDFFSLGWRDGWWDYGLVLKGVHHYLMKYKNNK